MLYHKVCKNLIRLNSYFRISTVPVVTRIGLRKGMAEIEMDLAGKKEEEMEFFCPHCKQKLTIDDLVGQCSMHGTFHPVDELFLSMDGAFAIMCGQCIVEYAVQDKKPLITLIK